MIRTLVRLVSRVVSRMAMQIAAITASLFAEIDFELKKNRHTTSWTADVARLIPPPRVLGDKVNQSAFTGVLNNSPSTTAPKATSAMSNAPGPAIVTIKLTVDVIKFRVASNVVSIISDHDIAASGLLLLRLLPAAAGYCVMFGPFRQFHKG